MRKAALLGALVALALPQAASAHAVLQASEPERGAALERAPGRVVLRFNEPVEIAFGAVRVFDARGERVDSGSTQHPDGDASAVGVNLDHPLADGGYTATYRVISADSHPVSGGFVFTVGRGGETPAASVADLIDDADAGPVTDAAFGIAKAISYAAIALAVGGVLFLAAVWLPALRATERAGADRRAATEAYTGRLRSLAAVVLAAGMVASAAGIVLQGATAAGISAWQALDPDVVRDVLGTRFGTVWGLRLLDWAALAALAALAGSRAAMPALRPLLVPLLGYLVLSPGLAGHSGTSDPIEILLPANTVHVLAMSLWAGGLALLVLALPAATSRLEGADRTRLLAGCLARFSPIALGAVVALVATGTVQSILHLEALRDLVDAAFGRAILAKIVLLVGLVGLGALNRKRSLPRLRRIAQEGGSPGREGLLLRRSLRAEIALLVGVFAATAALTSYAPPESLADGPFSAIGRLGPASVDLVVDPARVGPNEIHLYLTDARTGAPYDRHRDIGVQLLLPAKRIGPLEPRVDKAGPGHWVARRAHVIPDGDWQLVLAARVSEFEQHRARFEVPIR